MPAWPVTPPQVSLPPRLSLAIQRPARVDQYVVGTQAPGPAVIARGTR